MNSNPDPLKPQSAEPVKDLGSSADKPPATGAGAHRKSYTPKPGSAAGSEGDMTLKRKGRARWLLTVAVAMTLAISGLIWKQDSLPHWTHPWSPIQQVQMQQQILTLTGADVDQGATDAARAALARGEIPPALAKADSETRNKVLSGEAKLYTLQLEEDNQAQGFIIHVQVSQNGVLIDEHVLTPEHTLHHTLASTPGVPLHYHFTVEKAGPNGFVNPGARSSSGQWVRTGHLTTGQSGDVETVVR